MVTPTDVVVRPQRAPASPGAPQLIDRVHRRLKAGQDLAEQLLRLRQHARVEALIVEVLAAEALAVDLVDPIKLQAGLSLEAPKGADGLSREGESIHEKEYAASDAGLEQAVEQGDRGKGLAGAGGHREEHPAAPVLQSLLNGGDRFALIGTQRRVIDRRGA